jgi:glycopeptide antibiotics resistance protein
MQRNSIQIATRIILFSIITVTSQFICYYFLGTSFYTYGAAVILSLLFCHLFLESTLSFESCFSYSLLNIFLCLIVILLAYMENNDGIFSYSNYLFLFIGLNWLIPVVYCIFRNLMDKGSKFVNFNSFYRNISILFLIFYTAFLIYILFLAKGHDGLKNVELKSFNIIPFFSIASIIEGYIFGQTDLKSLILFFLEGISLYIPYGFYIILLSRNQSRSLRAILLLILPILVEVLQWAFSLGRPDIDDIFLALLGGFIGGLVFHILNSIYYSVTDENFLQKRSRYSFYRNSLHF